MARPQIIKNENDKRIFAVIPWKEYARLKSTARPESELTDDELGELADTESGEYLPIDVVKCLIADHNPIKVYRKYRGLTQANLAKIVGVSKMYISQIETGKRRGSLKFISAVAKALDVDVDDLI